MLVELTGYCPCSECCGDFADGVTSTGRKVSDYPYNIAASRSIPAGTRIYIPTGYGYLDQTSPKERVWTVDDYGHGINSEWERSGIVRLDLRYKTHYSAKKFGRKLAYVYVWSKDARP